MKIQTVRNDKDDLLFVESDADFVDVLAKIQHLPIGALATIANAVNAFATLQESCADLPTHIFACPQRGCLGIQLDR